MEGYIINRDLDDEDKGLEVEIIPLKPEVPEAAGAITVADTVTVQPAAA